MTPATAMPLEEAKAIFRRARVTARLCAPEWSRIYDTAARLAQIGARDPLTGATEAIATLSRKCPFDDEDLLFNAPLYLRASIMVAEAAFAEIERLRSELSGRHQAETRERETKDYAAQCAMLCQRGDFARYLSERHGLEATDKERVAARVRSVLSITSRAELNTDPAAAARWHQLRADFESWRKG
ncbi:hypothetical protein [Rhizobium arsenicireducens]